MTGTMSYQPLWPEWFINLRPHQAQAISDIMQGYNNGHDVVILQAPTGSGKTVIAEYVRRLLGVNAVYTCTTKALQDQVLAAFPYSSVVKGAANYPTELYPELFDNRWIDKITCSDCTGGDCSYCNHHSSCPYHVARDEAFASPLAVLNTSYYLTATNLGFRNRFRNNFPFKIIDECDELESELMKFVNVKITKHRMQKYGIPYPVKRTVESAWLGWTFLALDKIGQGLVAEKTRTANSEKDKRIKARTVNGLADLLRRLKLVNSGLQNTVLTGEKSWVYTGYDEGEIEFKPIKVDTFATSNLWSHPGKKLLMSGSVISPQVMAGELGLEKFHFVNMGSTFPKEHRPIYYIPSGSMSKKNKDDTLPLLVTDVAGLIKQYADYVRVIIHTHSYSNTEALWKGLVEYDSELNDRLIPYFSSTEKEDAIHLYRQMPNGVIIASSLDRGYDFPGDMCRMQIICKVPAPYLGDRQVSARMYGTKGGKSWYAVQTVRSIVQMAGRGIRNQDDWCKTYILDSDFSRLWRERQVLFPEYFREAVTFL